MKLKPKKRGRDCWDHFSMRYRCPACDAALTSYDYGRAWCPNGLREDQLIDCPKCGQEIDWSAEPRARNRLGESGGGEMSREIVTVRVPFVHGVMDMRTINQYGADWAVTKAMFDPVDRSVIVTLEKVVGGHV